MRFWRTFIKDVLEVILILIGFWIALIQITWMWTHYAPDSFHRWLNWISGGQVKVGAIAWPKHWDHPVLTLHELRFENARFKFTAEEIQFKANLFNDEDDSLLVHHWRVKIKQPTSSNTLNFKKLFSHLNLNAPRFWLPLTRLKMDKGIVHTGAWQINIPLVQWARHKDVKMRALIMTLYENTPVWAGRVTFLGQLDLFNRIQSGTFTFKTLQPMPLKNLAPLLQTRWKRGALHVDAAIRYQEGRPDVTVDVLLDDLRIPTEKGQPLDSLGARLDWKPDPNIWYFSISKWQINRQLLKNQSAAYVALSEGLLQLKIQSLNLTPFKKSLASLWPQWDWNHADLNVHNLNVHFSIKPFSLLRLSGTLTHFAWPEQDGIPGVDIQDIKMRTHHSVIEVAVGKPIRVYWAAFQRKQPIEIDFKQPIVFQRLHPGYWGMKVQEMMVDRQMPGKLSFEGNFAQGKLEAVLAPQTLTRVKHYLPYGLMGADLQIWLKRGLVKGEVEPVKLSFSGPWKRLFDPDKSPLVVQTRLKSTTLRFMPDWPALESLNATLKFKPFNLKVAVKSALLDGVRIGPALAEIGPLHKKDISLRVIGRAAGSGDRVLSLLRDSPLAKRLQLDGILDEVKVTKGLIKAQVALWTPLYGLESRALGVDVQAHIQQLSLSLPDGTVIKNLSGQFHATQQSAVSGGLKGEMYGHPVNVVVKTDPHKRHLNILSTGQLPLSKYVAGAQGWLPFEGKVFVPLGHMDKTYFHLTAKPKLQENKLPAPLNKIFRQPFHLTGSFEKSTLHFLLKSGASFWANGRAHLEHKPSLEYLVILLNQPEEVRSAYARHAQPGITVAAKTKTLKLSEWLKWWPEQVKKLSFSDASFDHLPHIDLGIEVENLYYQAQRFQNTILRSYDIDTQRLAFNLSAKQGEITGLYFPDNNQMVVIAQNLKLKFKKVGQDEKCESWSRPDDLKVFFVGKKVKVGKYFFDDVRFNLYADPAQLRIEGINVDINQAELKGGGKFKWDFQKNVSTFGGHIFTHSVENFFEWAGYHNAGFSGDKAVTDFSLNWSGAPDCFSWKKTQGVITFRLDEGLVKEADSGLAKIISLISVDSLLRNIRVTLKNLQYKGLAYDKIEGEAKIRHGWAYVKRFYLDAPSVVVRMKGGVDLIRHRLDLKANVSPRLMGSMTTLLAVFGVANPITAIGTYVFLKNTTNLDEGLITYRYHVIGNWASPQVIKLDDVKENKENDVEALLDDS